jgi:hypothetical protein
MNTQKTSQSPLGTLGVGRPVKIIIRYLADGPGQGWIEHPRTFTEHEYEKAKDVARRTYMYYEIIVVKEFTMCAFNQEPHPNQNFE